MSVPTTDFSLALPAQISSEEYATRRARLLASLPTSGLVLIVNNPEIEMTNGNPYRYRANTDFYYYTGLLEPEAILVLVHPKLEIFVDRPAFSYGLWVRPRDPAQEKWTGPRIGPEGAQEDYGAEKAYPLNDEGFQYLRSLLVATARSENPIYYWHQYADLKKLRIGQMLEELQISQLLRPNRNLLTRSFYELLSYLRLKKSPSEIARLRQVISISARAHQEAMVHTKPNMGEWQLDAQLTHSFMEAGCSRSAYPNIVGSGPRATILHYEANRARMADGDLVLVDAGGESVDLFSADITRTWPVNGCFSPAQREIYQLVLQAQEATLATVRPGVTLNDLQQIAMQIINTGLEELGIDGYDAETQKNRYYPHFIGHWLGREVHDCMGVAPRSEQLLEAGYVITVEPGIYLPPDDSAVPVEYRGIGVRIEDDVLVTEEGCEVLSQEAPKTIDEIEYLMKNSRFGSCKFLM